MTDNFFKDPVWLDHFLARMEKLMAQEGLEDQKDFNEKIGVQRALTRWKTRETSPSLKSCLKIKKAFGISLDWILFGEQPTYSAAEAATDRYESRPLPPLNEDLFIRVLVAVDECLRRDKIKPLTFQKAQLIYKLYDHCLQSKDRPTCHLVGVYWRTIL